MNILTHKGIFLLSALCWLISALALGAVSPSHSTADDRPAAQGGSVAVPETRVGVAAGTPVTINPPIPKKVTFAGKEYDMDRMDMYERLDRELAAMMYSHGSTLLMLKRANRYFPVMAPILRANGVPEDMVYLACIESTLNPRAYSPAKAAGLWQFMPETAKQYGLEVNDYVDERYHVEKATAAAARYLKNAYAKYGNWESAMAAYNAGAGRISKELDAQLQKSSFDLYLNEETSRYVFRVLAAKVFFSRPSRYGYRMKPTDFYAPYDYITMTVDTPIDSLPRWAEQQGTTYAILRELNPWLRAKSLPNKSRKLYEIKIPKAGSLSRSKNPSPKLYSKEWTK